MIEYLDARLREEGDRFAAHFTRDLAWKRLTRWRLAAQFGPGAEHVVADALEWVAVHLGRDAEAVREALETDDIAVLVWLLRGVVAVTDDGDVRRRIDEARRP